MVVSSIRGLIAHQIEFSDAGKSAEMVDRVLASTLQMLAELAWFQRYPVLLLAATTTLVCRIRHGTTLDKLDAELRKKFIARAGNLPVYDLLVKLLGSIALLHYFDAVEDRHKA